MTLYTIDFKRLNLEPGMKVLDVGCGLGRHSITAWHHGVFTVGVDLNFQDVQAASNRINEWTEGNCAERLYFAAANGLDLPFADQGFDVVICSEVLEHIEDYRATIAELRRVAKNGGIVAISVPNWWPEKICWMLSADYTMETGHRRIFRKRELKDNMIAAGLVCKDMHYEHGFHSPYWWLQALLGEKANSSLLLSLYKRFLDYDFFRKPIWLRRFERLINPICGKSLVMYFQK